MAILISNLLIHLSIGLLLIFIFGPLCIFYLINIDFSFIFNIILPFCIICCLFWSFFVINPINILLLILLSFILTSFLLFTFSLEILTYIFLIVYIGALMMLFLFVIMLFNLQQLKKILIFNISKPVFFIFNFFFFLFFFSIFTTFNINFNHIIISPYNYFSTIFFFSQITTNGTRCLEILYNSEANIFLILLTILLLYTMLGAITLAMSTKTIKK